jgi:CIC family chloride channel protein
MRKDVATLPAASTVAEFRRRYPLGSRNFVVLLDGEDRYVGLLPTAEAFNAELDEKLSRPVGELAKLKETALLPEMNVKEAMDVFGKAEAETLAVVDGSDSKQVVGLLNEAYATRRYAEALNNASRDVGVVG